MITPEELGRRVLKGELLIVGEVRAADVREGGFVDTKTGRAAPFIYITYFVERCCSRGFEIIKLTQRAPKNVTDPAQVPITVTKGKIYAFQVESMERKPGSIAGRLAPVEPEEVETGGMPVSAPTGAPQASAA